MRVGFWLRFEGMPDQLSALYNDLLEGGYDCVDRVILNAYFARGQFGGGFRIWWRALHGSDENLDDNHLMRMAGRFSRRLRAWAKENQIPVVYSSPGERKHDLASEHLARHETKPGLFMILVSKAPALIWEAQMTGTGKLGQLVIKEPWPYVNHYSFHILDPDWGHLTIKISGHPPFPAQVMLNGHEYVACQARKAGIGFTKEEIVLLHHRRRRPGEDRRYLVRQRTVGRLRQTLRALDLLPPALLRTGSGGAEAKRVSLPVFEFTRSSTAATCCSDRRADGRDISSPD